MEAPITIGPEEDCEDAAEPVLLLHALSATARASPATALVIRPGTFIEEYLR
jgi:hypothetical protein